MKSVMGFAFFLLFMAGIMFATMLEKPVATASDMARFTGVTWHPVMVANKALAEDSGIAVIFEPDGRVHGHGGCNTFQGSIERADSDFTVSKLATTRMACSIDIMIREDNFLDAMRKLRKIVGEGDELRLKDEHGNVLVVLTAAAESEQRE